MNLLDVALRLTESMIGSSYYHPKVTDVDTVRNDKSGTHIKIESDYFAIGNIRPQELPKLQIADRAKYDVPNPEHIMIREAISMSKKLILDCATPEVTLKPEPEEEKV